MTAAQALTFVGAVIVAGILAAVSIIRTWRRQSYRRWSWPARWAYLALVALLAAVGAVLWTAHMIGTWGGYAAASFLLAPLAFGAVEGFRHPSSTPVEGSGSV